MKVAYVSGPYRADTVNGIVQNIRRAEKVAVELWQMGYAVICAHKNTALLDGICDDDVWMKGDIEILKRCDLVIMIPEWQRSQGSLHEWDAAQLSEIPTFYWPDDCELLKTFCRIGQ